MSATARTPAEAPHDPVDYIERTRETYDALGYEPYRWAEETTEPPFVQLAKPMREWRVGIIASGGLYVRGQLAYHFRDDATYRAIPRATPVDELRVTHFAYDLADARADPNAVFPYQRLDELVSAGEVGSSTDTHFSFVGGLYSVRKCREQLAPALVEEMRAQRADAVVLVPV